MYMGSVAKAHVRNKPLQASAASWLKIGMTAFILILIGLGVAMPAQAHAQDASRPSVLVVEAGLGDNDRCALHWLGGDAQVIAEQNGLTLATASNAAWWNNGGGSGDAPNTFVLGSEDGTPVTSASIEWALDGIRSSGAEPRTFIVAMGATGLSVREYVEDLGDVKQSARADVVGLCFCGTPQNGYSIAAKYPESELWDTLARTIGRSVSDVLPGSTYLTNLNANAFPKVLKTLVLEGSVGDLGFGMTDGAVVAADMALPETVSNQVATTQVNATVSQAVNLTGLWEPFTSSINYPQRTVNSQLVERLSGIAGYENSSETCTQVRSFYESWFGETSPVTHNSNVLALDLSGSMVDPIDATDTKLSAAQTAAQEYLGAMQACAGLPLAAPMDVTVYGFGEQLVDIASSYDAASRNAIGQVHASGETNVGIALERAVSYLRNSPTCAKKHVLLLSDGATTRGMTDAQMLEGPVAEAKRLGIVIDAVGFGDIGESNAGFLKNVAAATGGIYYEANSAYDLKVNFLKSYYSSLGLILTDEELSATASSSESIGSVDDRTSALHLGIVAEQQLPNIGLTCNGATVDSSLYSVEEENGLLSVQFSNPPTGDYTVTLSGGQGAKHLFAVKQLGIPLGRQASGAQADYSLVLLIGAGCALVIAIVLLVFFSKKKAGAAKGPRSSWRTGSVR